MKNLHVKMEEVAAHSMMGTVVHAQMDLLESTASKKLMNVLQIPAKMVSIHIYTKEPFIIYC